MDSKRKKTKNVGELSVLHVSEVETIECRDPINVGQWYWIVASGERKKDDPINAPLGFSKLACVTNIGSNYVELSEPCTRRGGYCLRVHFDNVWTDLKREPYATAVIQKNIHHHQQRVRRLLEYAKKITSKLGIPSNELIAEATVSKGTDLAVISDTKDIDSYKEKLILAQEEQLPKILERVKEANEMLVKWMSAEAIGLDASLIPLEIAFGNVQDRILNVSLYAGLTEFTVKIKEGKPADYVEKIHLFQRMMYMDEECLLNYDCGGMEFEDIRDFDAWMSRPDNYRRILPFPKSAAVFQVRRNIKERRAENLLQAFINIELDTEDKYTFLYIRNGESLSRVTLEDFEFGEKLFPDKESFDPSEPMMAEIKYGSDVGEIITVREFEVRKKNYDQQIKTDKHLHARLMFRPNDYEPFDLTSVYYDDIMREVQGRIKRFNRMAIILQGLLDRSDIFHPHPPAKTWEGEGFNSILTLVYDGSMVLHDGEAPDIEAYINQCNALAGKKSVFFGQQKLWEKHEADKERERRRRSYRYRDGDYVPKYLQPEGNPGPGVLAKPDKIAVRSKKVTFSWFRTIVTWNSASYGEYRRATFTTTLESLFNVSAYQPGDYKRFFNDPRTRKEYLDWAPLLLTAEEYHQGARKAARPVKA